jgi:signal peptidase II
MPRSHKIRLAILLLTLGCTVGCDQASKHIARRTLGERRSVTLPGGFGEFRMAENSGSFLNLGDSLPKTMRLALFSVGVGAGLSGLLAFLVFGRRLGWPPFAGLALIWAGGASNLIDRVTRHGRVSDFIFIRLGPLHTGVFNVADAVITLGFALLVYHLWATRQNRVSF